MTISLPRRFLDEIITHAKREKPNECCGILTGKNGEVLKIYPTNNEEKSSVKYRIPAKEILNTLRDIENCGQEMIGIYHSHTHTEAYPSPTDVNLAFWPEVVYFILSLSAEPVLKAFNIIYGQVTEVDVLIT